jgi:hypothetical protein
MNTTKTQAKTINMIPHHGIVSGVAGCIVKSVMSPGLAACDAETTGSQDAPLKKTKFAGPTDLITNCPLIIKPTLDPGSGTALKRRACP